MTDQEVLDEFGKRLIEGGRNYTLKQIENLLTSEQQGPAHRLLRSLVSTHSAQTHEEYMRFATYVINDTLALVLGTIEDASNEGFDVQIRDPEGTLHSLNDISDGLSAELHSDDGWIARFGDSYTKE